MSDKFSFKSGGQHCLLNLVNFIFQRACMYFICVKLNIHQIYNFSVFTRANIVLHVVDTMCNLENSSLASPFMPCFNLLKHFQRFPVDKSKFEILKEIVSLLESEPKK